MNLTSSSQTSTRRSRFEEGRRRPAGVKHFQASGREDCEVGKGSMISDQRNCRERIGICRRDGPGLTWFGMTNILIHLPRFRKNDNVLKLCDPPLICKDVDHIISRCYNEDTRQGGRACKQHEADLPDIARRSCPVLVVQSPQRAGSSRLSTTTKTAHERSSNQPSAISTAPAEQSKASYSL